MYAPKKNLKIIPYSHCPLPPASSPCPSAEPGPALASTTIAALLHDIAAELSHFSCFVRSPLLMWPKTLQFMLKLFL